MITTKRTLREQELFGKQELKRWRLVFVFFLMRVPL